MVLRGYYSLTLFISCLDFVWCMHCGYCSLANQMRMLNYAQWMKLVTALFTNLLIILGRIRVF